MLSTAWTGPGRTLQGTDVGLHHKTDISFLRQTTTLIFSLTQQLAEGPGWILQHPEHFSKDTEQGKCHGWDCTGGKGLRYRRDSDGLESCELLGSLCSSVRQHKRVGFLLLLILVDKTLVTNTLRATSRDGAEAACKDPVQVYAVPKVNISLSYFVLHVGVFWSCSVRNTVAW